MELQLSAPAVLTLKSPDGSKVTKIDVYDARRMLEEAEKEPSQEARWLKVARYIADKLNIDPTELAESSAVEFHEHINRIVLIKNSERKKKLDEIVAWPDSTLVSPTTSALGQ